MRRRSRWLARHPLALAALLSIVAVVALQTVAWARVGGGESFSGSGDSGSDDFGLILFCIRLCIEWPEVGVPVTLVVIVYLVVKHSRRAKQSEWSTTPSQASGWEPAAARRGVRRDWAALRALDPQFSAVLFEDFLYALYSEAHEARGAGRLEQLAPYFTPAARASFHPLAPGLTGVRSVVVGAMKVVRVTGTEPGASAVRATVRFESNLEELRGEKSLGLYVVEVWQLSRPQGARSRPPEKARVIGCPSCGAALTALRGSTCSYCNQVVDTGAFDWRVDSVQVLQREQRVPQSGGGGVEQGTDLPTLRAPDAEQRLDALVARDPAFDVAALRARAELVFLELQAAWSERDWARARPYVSDALFHAQQYWIDGFKKQGVRNVIEQVQVLGFEVAAVDSDAYYDAITVRLFASCLDYVTTEDGKLVRGSRTRPTRFSEYWTFIRGVGRKGRPSAEKKCPNCGAPQKVSQAGHCEYCQAKVTSGEFEWILSRIEQDEVYTG